MDFDKENNCMTCGISREEMEESPWGRYVPNAEGKRESKIQCKPCREKELANQISEFQASNPDLDYTDDIICPHCGHQHSSDGENNAFYQDGEHDFDCGNCSNSFSVSTHVSYSYSTTKNED